MKAYVFNLTCRWCGGELDHITGGSSTGFDTRAIARCLACRTSWTVIVQLVDPSGGRSKSSPARIEAMTKAREKNVAAMAQKREEKAASKWVKA